MTSNYTWLPASMPNIDKPLKIKEANGPYLITNNGQKIYDAISSWWCKPLGHRHRLVKDSILEQLNIMEHHIHANTSNDIIEELSYQLIKPFMHMNKVMYASDGSSAIEIAMKLSYKCRVLMGHTTRNKFIALNGAYHGETGLALSVCGIDSFKRDYLGILTTNYFIKNIVYVSSRFDPLWSDCQFNDLQMEEFFIKVKNEVSALIIEPIVQGAGELKIISQDFLIKLIRLAHKYDIHVISDEIMVGLGRLGSFSVSKTMLKHEPEFICFAKNLTAGSIPMSAVVINKSITDLFNINNSIFEHSHTHSCNTLGAKVAVNYLKLLETSTILSEVNKCEIRLINIINILAKEFNFIKNPRAIGSIMACDLDIDNIIVNKFFQIAIYHGIYLRLINKTLYIMPPIYQLEHDFQEISTKLWAVLNELTKLIKP